MVSPRGLITALRTLTVLPVGGRDAERFPDALFWFPVVGGILGGMVWLLGVLWGRFVGADWAAGGAVMILWAEVVLTRALHLDGLADWADALGGGRDPDARLRIMKDPHLGAFGVVALVCVLLTKWVAWERLFSTGGLVLALPIFIASRAVLVHLMEGLPPARAGGGMAGPFLRDRVPGRGWLTPVLTLCLCLPFGPAGVGLYAVGLLMARLLGLSFRKFFGGISGDLLGATQELVETALLLLCASRVELLMKYAGWG
ncbi:MAG: adenosylcobinamide-GDP ribazoletransferase [Deltaproteobacteria bacterium]|nr:adenosylcobinamide-GDP ribazoletransferase [Deltaproteobacteria bacterium]